MDKELKISGRSALKIAGEDLDFMYLLDRQNKAEIQGLHEQVRILREEGEEKDKQLVRANQLAEQTQADLKDEVNFWRSTTMLMIVVVFAVIAVVRIFA